MEAEDLRRLWEEAGGRAGPALAGAGLFGLPVVEDPDALSGLAAVVVGLPLDGPAGALQAVRSASLRYAQWLPALRGGLRAADYGDVPGVSDDTAGAFVQAHERLADIVAAGALPVVLGGDGLVSVPVLQVLAGKLRGRLGVVAFTPGYDVAPSPPYSPRSRWARALELGVVSPCNLALVGGRAEAPDGPARLVLERLGAACFSVQDVVTEGVEAVAQAALEAAASGTEAVYVSVDVGVLGGVHGDPIGLTTREVVAGVGVVSRALLAAVDVCGVRGATEGDDVASAASRIAVEVMAGLAGRLDQEDG